MTRTFLATIVIPIVLLLSPTEAATADETGATHPIRPAHTGELCIQAAGHVLGDSFTAQANLMEKETVWDAMARAYTTTEGDLTERLLAALEAAEAEGGDIRGRQSAAILVIAGKSSGRPWADRSVEVINANL